MNEQISKILGNRWFEPVAVALGGISVGFAAGYVLGRRRSAVVIEGPQQVDLTPFLNLTVEEVKELAHQDQLRKELAEKPTKVVIPEEEAEEILHRPVPEPTMQQIPEKGEDDSPSMEVQERVDAFNRTGDDVLTPDDPEVISQSIFANGSPGWNYEEELKQRHTERPYIIHKDEFYTEESGYTQTTLTYYAGDNIMVDQEDVPVFNYETVTGPLLFGHGSEDPNVVYVRNDRRQAEYEILLDHGSYTIEVLGYEAEEEQARDIRHSAPKFKLVE